MMKPIPRSGAAGLGGLFKFYVPVTGTSGI